MTINIVQKYNGRSLYSMKKLREVAAHIASLRGEYENMVIVVGNMGQSTGDLIAMAKEAGQDIPKRELEVLLAAGEQQSASLLAIALSDMGVEAESMMGCKREIVAHPYFADEYANVKEINTERVQEIISAGKVAVVAGFQGIDETKDIIDLGRGGSDITAVGIAAHFGWDCEFYTTAECMYTADPQMYPEARPIKAITYEEMMEMTNLGADKVETRAVELAKKYNVKLFLGKSLEKDKSKGTYIVNKEMIVNENLKDVNKIDDLEGLKCAYVAGSNSGDLFKQLAKERNLNIDLQVFESGALMLEAFNQGKVNVFIAAENEGLARIKSGTIKARIADETINYVAEAYPFIKGDKNAQEINKIASDCIKEFRKDGTLSELETKWYTNDYSKEQVTE